MNDLETNIYLVTNLREMKSSYRLYRIRGLSADQEEYDPNIQTLVKKMRVSLRSPAAVILLQGEPHLVLREDAPEPPSPYPLVRATAILERTRQVLTLDYEDPMAETADLRIRFLQFAVEGTLFKSPDFWQPSSGHPFFGRTPLLENDGLCVYRGYTVRVISVEGGKLGFCIDVQHKYVSQASLPPSIKREEFRIYKYKHPRCVYRYGSRWYEIKLHDHTGLSLGEQMIPNEAGRLVSLRQFIIENAPKPHPPESKLSPNFAAVTYMTGREEVRHAAASLCYPVFDTTDARVRRTHRETILPPEVRRQCIRDFVRSHLGGVKLQGTTVRIAPTPVTMAKQIFLPPDLSFGHDTVYSLRGTSGAACVNLDQLGRTRVNALFNPSIGPYATAPLDRQYIVMPKSIWVSYGPTLLEDLKAVVNGLYEESPTPSRSQMGSRNGRRIAPTPSPANATVRNPLVPNNAAQMVLALSPSGADGNISYDPTPIIYDDAGSRTYAVQGRAILAAVDAEGREPGFGIAMIHETVDRRSREHDQLAAMVMRELRDRGLYVAVIHSAVGADCYRAMPKAPQGRSYEPSENKRGKLAGYLRNVALTKVLLTNERWPFVLASPLHADLTISIDVQLNTACYVLVGKSGGDIRTVQKTSSQKERLSKAQVRQTVLEVLREEAAFGRPALGSIVIQRDGRLFATEISGIKQAVETLREEGIVALQASLNFIEIPKKSAAPFRLFDVTDGPYGDATARNPQIGSYYMATESDGYLCTTGREFFHPGTTNPLHVKYVEGQMAFQELLEDVYALSCLAWTRPEDCTRNPITLKLADIRLREHAGGYDMDALEFEDEI